MSKKFTYTVDGASYKGDAQRYDHLWGHGLLVRTFSTEGNLRDSIGFVCHPEFDDFDKFQLMSTDELVASAIEILNGGSLEAALCEVRPYGMTLYFRLNGRDAQFPLMPVRRGMRELGL